MSSKASVTLPSGQEYPLIGLGTYAAKTDGEVQQAVVKAIKSGYRHIDGAFLYGNEREVGQGLRQALKEVPGIKREDIFVVSKLWSNSHHPDDVEPACRVTLKNLGLDYIDLYLIHWPHAFKRGADLSPRDENGKCLWDEEVSPTTIYLAMEKLVEKGLAKNIGLSNFNSVQIQDVLDKAKIKPATNQVECHPYFNQSKLKNFCEARGIILTAFSPLGAPHNLWSTTGTELLKDERLVQIGKKYNKSAGQIILRWHVQRGVAAVPKSVTPSRIEQNVSVFDFALTPEEMAIMDSFDLGPNGRQMKGREQEAEEFPRQHKHFPFAIEF